MLIPVIQTEDDVTDEQVAYLAGLADNLSHQGDFEINNYADSIVTSPDVQQALQMQTTMDIITEGMPKNAAADFYYPSGDNSVVLALSDFQQDFFLHGLNEKLKLLFSGFRRRVKRIFCSVATALGSDNDLDLKDIIKKVVVALIPVLAATTGLMAIALPIVVSLAAMLIKYGVNKVCPA